MPAGPIKSGSSEKIVYDTERIHSIGQQIVVNAGQAYDLMTPDWRSNILPYLEETPREDGFPILEVVMQLHKDRIQAAYDWQLAMGNTLKRIAEGIDQNELIIKDNFASD
jgi:hypothetical protein